MGWQKFDKKTKLYKHNKEVNNIKTKQRLDANKKRMNATGNVKKIPVQNRPLLVCLRKDIKTR